MNEKLLFIDTTGSDLVLGLVSQGQEQLCSIHTEEKSQRKHSEIINTLAAPLIPLAAAFAVVTGFGSWTGSRVGVVAAKAWSAATGKPIIALQKPDLNGLLKTAFEKFRAREFTDAHLLAPQYNAEFRVTPQKR